MTLFYALLVPHYRGHKTVGYGLLRVKDPMAVKEKKLTLVGPISHFTVEEAEILSERLVVETLPWGVWMAQ